MFKQFIEFLNAFFKTKKIEQVMTEPVKTITELWNEQSYFKLEELVSKEVFLSRGSSSLELFDENAIRTLIELRQLFGVSITINNWSWRGQFSFRGYRPWSYFTKQSFSQHSMGRAFDFDVKGLSADEAREKIYKWKKEGKLQYLTGVETGVSWVHIDCRICDRLDDDGLFKFSAT